MLPMHFYYFIQPFTSLSLRQQFADLQCSARDVKMQKAGELSERTIHREAGETL